MSVFPFYSRDFRVTKRSLFFGWFLAFFKKRKERIGGQGQEPNAEPEAPEQFFRNQNWNRPSLFIGTETQGKKGPPSPEEPLEPRTGTVRNLPHPSRNCRTELWPPWLNFWVVLLEGGSDRVTGSDSVSKIVLRFCGCFGFFQGIQSWFDRAQEAQNILRE